MTPMKPKSDNLFHFTRNTAHLKSILLNGFMPRHCLEDVRWLGLENHSFLAYPMVCFCDIPISRISEHTAFYGEYGLGMSKEWGLANGLAPVIYAPAGSAATKLADYLFELNSDKTPEEASSDKNLANQIYNLLSLVKPIVGNMLISGGIVEKDFYQECEWRYVPDEWSMIFEREFDSEKDAANASLESQKLEFTPAHVKYIFVKNDHEIPELVDFINTDLGHFPHNDLKILTTRIISLETIARDL